MKDEMESPIRGAFVDSLKRTNKEVRTDRAISIAEDAEAGYRQELEDMKRQYRKMIRNQRNTLDLSPENTQSLTMAKDFNGRDFAKRDIVTIRKARDLKIMIDLTEERYAYLFGGDIEEKKEEITTEAPVSES